jgi:biopolymer transport protein ExbB
MANVHRGDWQRSGWILWLRLAFCALLMWGLATSLQQLPLTSSAGAQDSEPAEPELDPSDTGSSTAASAPSTKQRTLLDTIRDGGYIGVIIILLSIVAVGFMIEHAISIRKERLMPEEALTQVEQMLAQGDLAAATQFCQDPRNYSLATDVILAGLERFQGSQFGYADYKSAMEEAGEDFTAKLYRKTDVLSVIGAIAPMLGLFGTVEGMMESFNTIASRGGMARPDELASSIGKALVTTWLGLIVAIPSMIAFSYFRNKIDSVVSECGKRVERVTAPLARRRA